ncbi:Tad domain-containing protein [Arthrobacter sp. 35W]|uniref:Tad domain-containing protein n=1 Tax=Arthrobacter sp. 35W TaxID=1132441 RepID=UPI000684BC1C|nr:Tad domain-containing protein [Arthrobacter sp. 35W]
MRFTKKRSNTGSERGAASVVVALLMVALIGFAAIAVDVGMMYSEKVQLQNGADSAALAVANECAKGNGNCGSGASSSTIQQATAGNMANANANDHAANTAKVTFPTADTVKVNVSSRDSAGHNAITLMFASIFGVTETDIPATATAKWAAKKTSVDSIPWTFGKCVLDQRLSTAQRDELKNTGTFTGSPDATHVLLRSDTNGALPGCTEALGYPDGGFGWLDLTVAKTCSATIKLGVDGAGSAPGGSIDNSCKPLLDGMLSKPVSIPVFSSSLSEGGKKGGQKATYTIYGFAQFQVTGWRFPSTSHADTSTAAPTCGPPCEGFIGYFTGFTRLQDAFQVGTGPGGLTVQLIK